MSLLCITYHRRFDRTSSRCVYLVGNHLYYTLADLQKAFPHAVIVRGFQSKKRTIMNRNPLNGTQEGST